MCRASIVLHAQTPVQIFVLLENRRAQRLPFFISPPCRAIQRVDGLNRRRRNGTHGDWLIDRIGADFRLCMDSAPFRAPAWFAAHRPYQMDRRNGTHAAGKGRERRSAQHLAGAGRCPGQRPSLASVSSRAGAEKWIEIISSIDERLSMTSENLFTICDERLSAKEDGAQEPEHIRNMGGFRAPPDAGSRARSKIVNRF